MGLDITVCRVDGARGAAFLGSQLLFGCAGGQPLFASASIAVWTGGARGVISAARIDF